MGSIIPTMVGLVHMRKVGEHIQGKALKQNSVMFSVSVVFYKVHWLSLIISCKT